MMNNIEIIDAARNPFGMPCWIKQGYKLTSHRQQQLKKLFGKTQGDIFSSNVNAYRYPAFVGIRWGYAELQGGILVPTNKWKRSRF
ncbi:MAG: hypothetical protein KAH38_08475 [Candidatus Hydrogenedentes bacterium]|nr:hypothetical protein [Candidatus Hydrogenedentota bacterium]